MIDYFNIPPQASIDAPVGKKLFAEKAVLSVAERGLLRHDVEKITMRGLLQTRTIGLPAHVDEELAYDQIIVGEAYIKNPAKALPIATMIQRAFPAPLFLIIHSQGGCCVNWCLKRINQADKTRRVMEEQKITRFFAPQSDDKIVKAWLPSLDITAIHCQSLKELFQALASRLLMLAVSDEAGVYIECNKQTAKQYSIILQKLTANRAEQKRIAAEIKAETQFNLRLKLTTKLKELQTIENELKNKLI